MVSSMRFTLGMAGLPLLAQAAKIVMSNDDGWAEINLRTFYERLTCAGNTALISAPAENKSGTGSSDEAPETVGDSGCEFGSCLPGSPAVGNNASMPQFNYVNSYPVTSTRYGIQNLSHCLLGGSPDLAVAGPNVGANLGIIVPFSGTVGAATEAAKEGVPAIAFSGSSGEQTAWNVSVPGYASVYADLSVNVTSTLLESGTPYLPGNVWLNVNYPQSTNQTCSSVAEYKFVLSRINAVTLDQDVETCNNGGRLPTENDVVGTEGCYASISVGHADDKGDASADEQAEVLGKLSSILSCLPSS